MLANTGATSTIAELVAVPLSFVVFIAAGVSAMAEMGNL